MTLGSGSSMARSINVTNTRQREPEMKLKPADDNKIKERSARVQERRSYL